MYKYLSEMSVCYNKFARQGVLNLAQYRAVVLSKKVLDGVSTETCSSF